MKRRILTTLGLLCIAESSMATTVLVNSTISNTVGTSSIIPEGSGGDLTNTASWTAGVVGKFGVLVGGNQKYMTVEATVPTGSLNTNDSLMVVRTVGSQGLTDTATLSVYVNTSATGTGTWTLDLAFKFWEDEAATNPYSFTSGAGQFELTSLDVDFSQKFSFSTANFSSFLTYTGSVLTTPTPPSGYQTYQGASGGTQFYNPTSAVSGLGTGSTFNVQLAHNTDRALYMFEFRDPATFGVPEPAAPLLGGIGMLLLLRRRRSA